MAPRGRTAALAAAAAALATLPPPAAAWGGVYDVRDYGAVGDGATLDTRALRVVLSLVSAAGGGEVLFPSGYRFLTGPLNFTSNVLLRVQGALAFAATPDDWPVIPNFPWYGPPDPPQFQPALMGWGVSNVTLTGGGVVDGNGSAWWRCAVAPAGPPCHGVQRPAALFYPHNGTGVTVANVTLRDSPFWHLRPSFIDGVLVANVTITAAPAGDAHNTDGIDPDCCRHVLVEDCDIAVGDDLVAIKAGLDAFGQAFGRPSYNLTFRRIRGGTGHGLSIGSEMSAGVSDVLFEDITLNGTDYGPRVKSGRGRGGYVANVTYRNIVAHGVPDGIYLTMTYNSSTYPPANMSGNPTFDNITVANFTLASVPSRGKSVGFASVGLNDSAITGVTLAGVDLRAAAQPLGACEHTAGACAGVLPSCPPCLQPGGD